MINLLLKPVSAAWLLLMLATCLSWWLGGDSLNSIQTSDYRLISSGLILIAFIKVRIVIRYFMEVRQAPLALKLVCDSWVALVCGVILYLYWLGHSPVVVINGI
ncbi:MAG: cytochrome C oxidase subunit IV family protein [Porticoccaceae bacterium]|nr:cytochrome C oxidase subunit IV family protein [Porticoccaceae bacterium]